MSTGEHAEAERMSNSMALAKAMVPSRHRPARRVVRAVLVTLLLAFGAGVFGFMRFADKVAALEPPLQPKADAIVVLTGGFQRIDQGLELLKSGAGKRLLISGVHPATSGKQILSFTRSSPQLFDCCVDIGHDAIDTIGNANETARWISNHGYHRVLVVTNNYHMPRSLLELRRSDEKTTFLPYPVVNSDLKNRNWLREPLVLRTMLSEYLKYSVAKLRDIAGAGSANGLRGEAGAHSAVAAMPQ